MQETFVITLRKVAHQSQVYETGNGLWDLQIRNVHSIQKKTNIWRAEKLDWNVSAAAAAAVLWLAHSLLVNAPFGRTCACVRVCPCYVTGLIDNTALPFSLKMSLPLEVVNWRNRFLSVSIPAPFRPWPHAGNVPRRFRERLHVWKGA